MAQAIGCGLSSGVLWPEKSALLCLTPAKTTGTTAVWWPVKSRGNAGKVAASVAPAAKTARKPRGIMVARPISPEMQDFVGVSEIPRTQAMKLIWAYIKANNLQDPNDKKVVICDEKLKKILKGRDSVGFLEISGLITDHFL